VGCGSPEEKRYERLSDLYRTNDGSIVAAIAVPEDAANIRVRLDAETGLYYISYATLDYAYSVRTLKLSRVESHAYKRAHASLSFGLSLPADADIYFGCRPVISSKDANGPVRDEVILVANASGRQYQWNQVHYDDLMHALCR